jgi:uncharacterized protein
MATERNTETFYKVALVVAIIGALNWGLIGFFNFNLVDAIFGGGAREQTSALSRVVYALVGLCGAASTYFLSKARRLRAGAPTGAPRPERRVEVGA